MTLFALEITEAEETWQYVLQDRKKRRSMNTVTAYCDRIAKVYSKNPPTLPKPPQKMRLLDRVKVKHVPERPPPLPPLVPNIVPIGYSALPMPGENGVKQHCKGVDIKLADDNMDDNVSGKKERPKWTGLEDIMLAYKEYSKGTRHEDLPPLCDLIQGQSILIFCHFCFTFVTCCREGIGEEGFDERNIKTGGTVKQLTVRNYPARATDIRVVIR